MSENPFFSLKQYQEQAEKNIENINSTIADLNSVANNFNHIEQMKFDISKASLEKISFLINELTNNEDNLLNFASTLRFSFETLIHTKIFFKEPEHIIRLKYRLYTHYEEKYTKLIKRVEEEILLLKEIETFENQKTLKLNNEQLNIDDVDKLIDKKFGSNITMFFEGVKFNGYGFHQNILKEKVQKIYENELEKFKSEKNDFEVKIIKNKIFQEIYGINIQSNQVEKKISDGRNWKEKAHFVNLEKEYKLMYDLTSSLIHSTSYSLLTNSEMIEQEKKLYYNLLNQYVKQINENLRLFCSLDLFLNKNVNHVNIVSEKSHNDNIDNTNLKMNGFCPQCLFINSKKTSMKINSSDYFECPECNLQILNNGEEKIASIIPKRGKGDIYKKDSSEVWLKNFYLSKAKLDGLIAKPELVFFQNPDELKQYLKTIK